LDEPVRRAYRLLGLWTGPDLDFAAAAVLLGETGTKQRLLDVLVRSCLLGLDAAGRYRFHR